jgi:RNA polymerase sigma-70 factor (ECF subfamily)
LGVVVVVDDHDAATDEFLRHRGLLFSIAYNILGSVADTEDVIQETWMGWASRRRGGSAVENPRAYLVRIAVNGALGRRSVIERRQESYPGPWLPEPLVASPAEAVETAESVSFAIMVVLETLTPLERSVFVLGDVFGYTHAEIAAIVDRTPAAVRQLAHRAREHVQARRPRFSVDTGLRERVTERFLAALLGGDLDALMDVLAPEVVVWTDGGGKARMTGLRGTQPRERVARMLAAGAFRPHPAFVAAYRDVNGERSIVMTSGGEPFAVVVLDIDAAGAVCGVYAVTNPDKLIHVS